MEIIHDPNTKEILNGRSVLINVSKNTPLFIITNVDNLEKILLSVKRKIEGDYGVKMPFGCYQPDTTTAEKEALETYREVFMAISPIKESLNGGFFFETDKDSHVVSSFLGLEKKHFKAFLDNKTIEAIFISDEEEKLNFVKDIETKKDLVNIISEDLFRDNIGKNKNSKKTA